MDKEKLEVKELTEKEMKQVSGGIPGISTKYVLCDWRYNNDLPCDLSIKGQHEECATCSKNN